MRLNTQLGQNNALLPQSLASANKTGDYFSAGMVRRMLFTLITGAIAAAGTVKIELLQATDSTGTGAKAIEGASATITATDAKTQGLAFVELDTANLDANNGFIYVSAKVTTTATVLVGVTMVTGENRFTPVNNADAYAVV
jgi:hypothetical protein